MKNKIYLKVIAMIVITKMPPLHIFLEIAIFAQFIFMGMKVYFKIEKLTNAFECLCL